MSRRRLQNSIVPDADLKVAVQSVEKVITKKQRKLCPNVISKHSSDENMSENVSSNHLGIRKGSNFERSSNRCDFNRLVLHGVLEQLKKSIISNLLGFANPVSADEFGKILRNDSKSNSNSTSISYIDFLDNESSDSAESNYDLDDSSSDDEEDYDEIKYVDQEAQARVKSLRVKVRGEALKLRKLQSSVPQHIADFLESEINLYINQIEEMTSSNKKVEEARVSLEKKTEDKGENFDIFVVDWEDGAESIRAMRKALKRLSQSLVSIENTLPAKLEKLQGTIHAIEESLDKRLKMTKNKKEIPPIERAILAREDRRKENKHEVEEKESITPKEMLAMFVAR